MPELPDTTRRGETIVSFMQSCDVNRNQRPFQWFILTWINCVITITMQWSYDAVFSNVGLTFRLMSSQCTQILAHVLVRISVSLSLCHSGFKNNIAFSQLQQHARMPSTYKRIATAVTFLATPLEFHLYMTRRNISNVDPYVPRFIIIYTR